ncbi:hypothetical protein Ae406Ps2_3792c [Pseudonocardia sp. Ae406_Ps2]|nr:hypothetical protein Ae331Ps2_2148 [Pseudonocardia sp. Ae331_Ps2]OLM03792.1 hypothetical protein Ae406Ps2_3792c [Pseudonocardia sp. Ae406_Ps2]OLM11355.1 hypothetical protein Ae505Ps2_1479 [Pseudonocardia sp. Ae505_Ps2]OLM25349.1 hypothetical protein Ae706Ps2_3782c [Pseudonocardia sp. Ae706_Ps2]
MKIIEDQWKRFNDPDSGAKQAYGPALAGLRHAVRSGDDLELRRMIFRASRTMVRSYEELAAGMQGFLARSRPEWVSTNNATWTWATLPINVNQHVGMRLSGVETVVHLYLKQTPLTAQGATKVIWRTLQLTVDQTRPHAAVAVLDVRRGKLWKPTPIKKIRALDAWIESEALGYIEHWRRSAA